MGVVLIPALIALLPGRQGDAALEKKVTFSTPAEPVSLAMDQLSSQGGVSLTAGGPVGRQMIVLRFKAVPLKEAMAKIAEASTAEWQPVQGGYQLVRTGAIAAAVQQKEHEEVVSRLRKSLEKRTAAVGTFDFERAKSLIQSSYDMQRAMRDDTSEAGWLRVAHLAEAKPGGRLITRVLSAMGVEQLASLSDGVRTVFSLTPNRMQRQLNPGVAEAVRQFAVEQNVWNDAVQQIAGGDDPTMFADGWSSIGTSNAKFRPGKLLVICEGSPEEGMISIQAKLFDDRGRIVASPAGEIMPTDFGSQMTTATEIDLGQPQKAPESKIAEKFGPLVREWVALSREKAHVLSPELRDLLVNPEKRDPLAFLPSEPLLTAAEMADVDVAACVDDDALISCSDLPPAATAEEFLKAMKDRLGKATLQDNWLVAAPNHPLRLKTESRAALGTFLRATSRLGHVSLEPLATYAQSQPAGYYDGLAGSLAGPLLGNKNDYEFNQDWQYLRLYGSLTLFQRQALLSGQSISLLNFSPDQRAIATRIVFGQEINTEPDPDEIQRMVDAAKKGEMIDQMDLGFAGLDREPTELMPNGLDDSGAFTMTSDADDVIFPLTQFRETAQGQAAMDIDTIAWMMLAVQHRELFPGGADQQWSVEGFRLGRRTLYQMTFTLPRKATLTGSVEDDAVQAGQPMAFDKLPADLRKQIQTKMDELAASMKGMKPEQSFGPVPYPGRGGTRIPPPLR